MKEELVPYELAVKLKALGFDEPCLLSWNLYTHEVNFNGQPSKFTSEDVIQLPTFSQSFRWFREKYNLHANKSGNENYTLFNLTEPEIVVLAYCDYHKTKNHYEEAELTSLDKLIEIVETKTK